MDQSFLEPLPSVNLTSPRHSYPVDCFARPLKTLRISLTDRCNFHCAYCLPQHTQKKDLKLFSKTEKLTMSEFLRLAKIFTQLGVEKMKLTGGEPLLYRHLISLADKLHKIPGLKDISLTTNGALLKNYAAALKKAGLQRVTVSLDTLEDPVFRSMHGRQTKLKNILLGIAAAQKAGFSPIKINAVIQRGVNENAILSLARHFRGTPHILRFIEFMDTGNCNQWQEAGVVTSAETCRMIHEHYPLIPAPKSDPSQTADTFFYQDGQGKVEFISAVTKPFCANCNRMRLASNGTMYTCLFSEEGTDLRIPMRDGACDEELTALIARAWESRADKYSENRPIFRALKENIQKIEMFQIGG